MIKLSLYLRDGQHLTYDWLDDATVPAALEALDYMSTGARISRLVRQYELEAQRLPVAHQRQKVLTEVLALLNFVEAHS